MSPLSTTRILRVKIFIQARMSSKRFPGKVLSRFRGSTVLGHVVERAAGAVPRQDVVVATSLEGSDDPVAAEASRAGAAVFRGPLEDVFSRLQACLAAHPCDWFFRVSADSPLIDPAILRAMLPLAKPGVDLVTNVHPRTFPKGQSAELLNAASFARLADAPLTAEQREHVTPYLYENAGRFNIVNLASGRPDWPGEPLTVDTPEDSERLQRRFPAGGPLPSWAPGEP